MLDVRSLRRLDRHTPVQALVGMPILHHTCQMKGIPLADLIKPDRVDSIIRAVTVDLVTSGDAPVLGGCRS